MSKAFFENTRKDMKHAINQAKKGYISFDVSYWRGYINGLYDMDGVITPEYKQLRKLILKGLEINHDNKVRKF